MLGPHDREDAELDEVGLAPQRVEDALVFLVARPWASTTSGVIALTVSGIARALAAEGEGC